MIFRREMFKKVRCIEQQYPDDDCDNYIRELFYSLN